MLPTLENWLLDNAYGYVQARGGSQSASACLPYFRWTAHWPCNLQADQQNPLPQLDIFASRKLLATAISPQFVLHETGPL